MFLVPTEFASIPTVIVTSSQLKVDKLIHLSNPLPFGIQDSADIDNPIAATVVTTTPTLKEVFVVHQIGQDKGPPILGGSCTYDPEGLMNGQIVGGFGNILSKSECKLDLGHQVEW